MKLHLLFAAGGACLLLGSGAANAGQCTDAIAMLEKGHSAQDMATDPGAAAESAGSDAMDQATDQASGAGEAAESEAPLMGELAEGEAGSSDDMAESTEEPSAAEAAEAEQTAPAAGEMSDPLQQAKELDEAGKEAECMAAVAAAKEKMGM